ncbi:hypothetical protein [Streptomyces bacillaris]|uniref:Uncharacterized protein n=1 Tax=Streptomyces bacillaris TaxID=68179 RepID=A0ABW6E6R4_9ACTN
MRGAQAGFLSRSSLLNVPDDLASCAGPGLTTVPLTPRTVHTITVRLPNPLRAAAIAALLFTGTDKSLLSMTQIGSLEADRIHPDDLASALEWTPHRLQRAATTLAAHLEQSSSPHRLIHTDTAIHLTCVPDLLTGKQRQNLHNSGHTASSLAPARPQPSPASFTTPPAASPPTCPPIRSRAWLSRPAVGKACVGCFRASDLRRRD